jgi:hypothetical protein
MLNESQSLVRPEVLRKLKKFSDIINALVFFVFHQRREVLHKWYPPPDIIRLSGPEE